MRTKLTRESIIFSCYVYEAQKLTKELSNDMELGKAMRVLTFKFIEKIKKLKN